MNAPDNVYSLKSADLPLCVECLSCGHKALVEPAALERHSNVADQISIAAASRLLRCSRCRSRATKSFRPANRQAAEAFLVSEA